MNKAAKWIAAALALAVVVSAAWIVFAPTAGEELRVVIEVDGEVYASYDLDEVDGIIPISTPNGGENRVYAQSDLVYMESANCPDKLCVKQGVIRDGTVPIVCLPNKVVVRIEGRDSDLDGSN